MADLAAQISGELTTASAGRAVVPVGTGSPGLLSGDGPWLTRLKAFGDQPAVRRAMPMVALVGAVGVAALAWSIVATPDARALYPQASEADRSAMAEALTAAGVGYAIDPGTGALTVGDADYYRARMLLAGAGLPQSGPGLAEGMDAIPIGSSRAVEGERIRDARQADLARTIEAIDVVQSARVHLAVAEPSAFVRDSAAPAASVMLTLHPGRTMAASQVQAIVDLVAASVPGLSPDRVSVVDQHGQSLSRQAMLGSGVAERQVALRQQMENDYQRSLAALLTPIVGEGNFTAEVHADLDFSEVQSTRDSSPQPAGILVAEEGQMSMDAEPGGEGIPGTLANTPPPPATVTTEPTSEGAATVAASGRRTENYVRRFALGREVAVTRAQSPNLTRLSVAVAIRNTPGAPARSAAELRAIEQLVKGAIGFDARRGDVVALSARAFVAPTTIEQPWWEAAWFTSTVRYGAVVAILALLLFGLFWPLYRRAARERAAREAIPFDHIEGQQGAIAGRSAPVTLDMIEATQGYEQRAQLIRSFVKQDPARAALVVRDLIQSDIGDGGQARG